MSYTFDNANNRGKNMEARVQYTLNKELLEKGNKGTWEEPVINTASSRWSEQTKDGIMRDVDLFYQWKDSKTKRKNTCCKSGMGLSIKYLYAPVIPDAEVEGDRLVHIQYKKTAPKKVKPLGVWQYYSLQQEAKKKFPLPFQKPQLQKELDKLPEYCAYVLNDWYNGVDACPDFYLFKQFDLYNWLKDNQELITVKPPKENKSSSYGGTFNDVSISEFTIKLSDLLKSPALHRTYQLLEVEEDAYPIDNPFA